ncbi:Calcium-responsive transcription factor [Paramuricea clavata]|uniref:Calcium-responsive transcription factor n=1 Tax=Paramuricea clavata TaxID=317549 RepID=A0A6S7GFN8_PARCT|nr:Calcium-responsive transcription factor [Paramuricea clavata]
MFILQYKILKCLVLNVNSGTTTYICDFHCEQAWEQWLKKGDNGLMHKKDDVLKLLQTVAKSNTEDDYHKNLSVLQQSEVWLNHLKFQKWFKNTWLEEAKAS